jgi:hypothetical protein
MLWQLKSDPQGSICSSILGAVGNNTNSNNNSNVSNNTSPNNTLISGTVQPAPGAFFVISMFYCTFGANYCGQSTSNDVNPNVAIVILAFANTNSDGSITVD